MRYFPLDLPDDTSNASCVLPRPRFTNRRVFTPRESLGNLWLSRITTLPIPGHTRGRAPLTPAHLKSIVSHVAPEATQKRFFRL